MNSFVKVNPIHFQATDIQEWIVRYISNLLDITEQQVKLDKPFSRIGMDSASIAAMTGELSQWLGAEIDPSVAYDYATIDKFSEHLALRLKPTQARNSQHFDANLSL